MYRNPWTEFRDTSSFSCYALPGTSAGTEEAGAKLNTEDNFWFPDLMQEQYNHWFFHLQRELGQRAERAEGAGRGRGPGHEELNVRHEKEPGGLHHPCAEKPGAEGRVPAAQAERAGESS